MAETEEFTEMTRRESAVLDRWASGDGAGLIAKDFRRNADWVRRVVRNARKAGDRRAISHTDAVAGTDLWRTRFAVIHRQGKIAGWEFIG